jgi:putative NADH-flavin reductase
MKVAIIGASGKTGTHVVRESLKRGYQVVAVCRDSSVTKLDEFKGCDGFTVWASSAVSDEAMLTKALAGCDAVVGVPMTVHQLKATTLVESLKAAAAVNGVQRLVFTAGEVTVAPEEGEALTLRQRLMLPGYSLLLCFLPYSLADMRKATAAIRRQSEWEWTIVRAPTLTDTPAAGYKFCSLSEITWKHVLPRADYAACLLDSLTEPKHHRRTLTVVSAKE